MSENPQYPTVEQMTRANLIHVMLQCGVDASDVLNHAPKIADYIITGENTQT